MYHRKGIAGALGMTIVAALALVLTGSLAPRPALAGTGSCRELLVNGGFEAGSEGWSEYSKLGFELIDPFYPFTGAKSAWLGADNDAEDWISQTVTLPSGTTTAHLTFWWSIFTEEAPGGGFDFLWVQLLGPGSTTLITTTHTIHNDSAEAWLWTSAEATVDLSAYAGQAVQLRFTARNDLNNPTSFFVDDVSLEGCDVPPFTPRAWLFLPLVFRP